jgi:hypothetical protein
VPRLHASPREARGMFWSMPSFYKHGSLADVLIKYVLVEEGKEIL